MIKHYRDIDMNKPVLVVGLKVKEITTGKIAKITGVYAEDDEVWMVSGSGVGVISFSEFWQYFEEIKS